MPYRPYRLDITGKLAARSPLHIGTGERLNLSTDAPILREGNRPNGRPYIPGSSLRGVLRAHIERERALLGCSNENFEELFGPERGELRGSRLKIFDARLTSDIPAEVRDHVRIKPEWGAADAGAKFDGEAAIPGGARFEFGAVYEGESEDDHELILLHEALRYLQSEAVSVGAKSAWGYGRIQLLDSTYRSFNRKTDEGLASYFGMRLALGTPTCEFPPPAILPASSNTGNVQPFSTIAIGLQVRFSGPVLIKAPVPPALGQVSRAGMDQPWLYGEQGQFAADHVFVSRLGQQYYLPGSSLRGVLRSQANRIAATLGKCAVFTELFGFAKEGMDEGRKGNLEILDGELLGTACPVFLDHVALDRITNAAVDVKKFDNSALASPVFETSVRLRFTRSQFASVALFALVLRDLMQGRLWAGSGTSRGFGYISSAAIISIKADLVKALDWSAPEGFAVTERPGRIEAARDGGGYADLSWIWDKVEEAWKEAA